jgi:putative ABC transport system permease protein
MLVAASLAQDLRYAVRMMRRSPAFNVRTMDEAIVQAAPRFNVSLLGIFAAIAWLLATVGVYGVTACGVARRTREIGIRMALGARAGAMLAMVMRETLSTSALAVGCGLVSALAVSRAMAGMLYGVTTTDVSALAGAAVALLVTATVAAALPAGRAARVEPMTVLKAE